MENRWMIEIVLALVVAITLHCMLKGILRLFCKAIGEFEKTFLSPLRLLLWVVVISYLFFVLNHAYGPFRGAEYIAQIRICGIIISLTWLGLRWKKHVEARLLKAPGHHQIDPATASAIGKLLTIGMVFFAAIWILQVVGVNIVPLLTFGGIGAAAMGFAAKDVIANFFGGFLLYITRPFTEGEEIVIDKEGIQGVVEQIGWCLTSLRDIEARLVYMPNSLFSRSLVINVSRMSHRRIYETLSIDERHSDELIGVVQAIREHIQHSSLVDSNMPCFVSLEHIGGDGLELSIDVYTEKTRREEYREVRQKILLMVVKILQMRNIEAPVPQTIIKLEEIKTASQKLS